MQRWIEAVESGRIDAVTELLADDAVFHSPAVFTPQEGKNTVIAYLTAAGEVFAGTGFQYMERWYNDRSAILEFVANIDGVYINGIDMVRWNDDETIVEVKVMLRPLKALQTVIPKMGELLARS